MTSQDILNFWFSELKPAQWFNGGPAVDDLIRNRFEPLIDTIASGAHMDWLATAQGKLASILVLDQFPRNLYRATAQAFAYDDQALKITLDGIARGEDMTLGVHERAFFYLPLEHREEQSFQDRSLERFANLTLCASDDEKKAARSYLTYAWRHYAIIAQFGRYPHRNRALGRPSTDEEITFLAGPNSSF